MGFRDIRIRFDLETEAPWDRVAKIVELTERYCVVYRTLCHPPRVEITFGTLGSETGNGR